MRKSSSLGKVSRVVLAAQVFVLLALMAGPQQLAVAQSAGASRLPKCSSNFMLCTEVYDSEDVFGQGVYVGHDEPSVLFYSDTPGAGNRNRYILTLPKDPPHDVVPGRSWNFQLHPAFWVGMAMCDTQSYPEQVSTCTPDSDSNITPLAQHAGTAFMELQFYPPGWVKQFDGQSCDNTKWCAALNIDSLSRDPINGQDLNATCQNQILGGIEPVNFAFVTKDGKPTGPPNPLDFNPLTSGAPDPQRDLFMNPGDRIEITLFDTPNGLRTNLRDLTTGDTGFMVASATNNFGQIKFAPTGTSCTVIPYDFHPMYSTSSPQTRVPWAAHSYNIAFSDEIGHWDYCDAVSSTGGCTGNEGDAHANSNTVSDVEKTDGDDFACFNPPPSPFVQVRGCFGQNNGFDGVSYHLSWPDGDTNLHPTTVLFTSPKTAEDFDVDFKQAAFEADLPRIERNTCNRVTGVGCTLIPTTDDNVAADFYPFYSVGTVKGTCSWGIGSYIPGFTKNDFGGNAQYGKLLKLEYLVFGGHGATIMLINDFRQILNFNPCASGDGAEGGDRGGDQG